MRLARWEALIRWLGAALATVTLAVLLGGVWRGMRRAPGRTAGRTAGWLRSAWFYLAASAAFFGACWRGWVPLPVAPSPAARAAGLVVGTLLYFPGMGLVLWGRLALGRNYFVSTGLAAQLFAGHQLVTRGPYACVRHPMYAGLALAAWGGLLVYRTWTSLLLAGCAPLIGLRARSEEAVLAAEFGEQWQAYCRRVGAFVPRW